MLCGVVAPCYKHHDSQVWQLHATQFEKMGECKDSKDISSDVVVN